MPEGNKKSARSRRPPAHLMNEIYSAENYDSSINAQITSRRALRHNPATNTLNTAAQQLVNFIKTINRLSTQSSLQKQKEGLSQKMQQEAICLNNPSQSKRKTNQVQLMKKSKKQVEADIMRREKIEHPREERKSKNTNFQHSFQAQFRYQAEKNSQFQFPSKSSLAAQVDNTKKKSARSLADLRIQQMAKLVNQSHKPSLIRQIIPQQNARDLIQETNASFKKNQQSNQFVLHNKGILKRASFHIGAAYYIFIDKLKKNKANRIITPDDLDPIAYSRKRRHQAQIQDSKQQEMRRRKGQATKMPFQSMAMQEQFPEQRQIDLPKNIEFEQIVFEPKMQKMQEQNEVKDTKGSNIMGQSKMQ